MIKLREITTTETALIICDRCGRKSENAPDCSNGNLLMHTVHDSDHALREVLAGFLFLLMAIVFGSVAWQQQHFSSDLDIAVAAKSALSADQKMDIIAALAAETGRPIDLIDLTTAPEPLLSQIVQHGSRLLGSDREYGQLISRHLYEQADFMPHRNRILAERRAAWRGT
jgi:predicted nucleotidyltransferase